MADTEKPGGLERGADAQAEPAGQSAADLATLLKASRALASSLELPKVLQTAIESTVEALALETGAIYLLEGDGLYLGATTPPLPRNLPDELRYAKIENHPHISRCLESGGPVELRDFSRAALTPEEREVCESRGLKSLLFLPLLVEDEPVGAMIVGTMSSLRTFGEWDVDLCRMLSHQVSLAVANARLFDSLREAHAKLERAYDETLLGWSMALEMRDSDTRGHAERVARLTLELARRLGIPEEEMPHVHRGALLHDIGKMTVPDTILGKPAALSEAEWEVMRRHPEHARQMLESIEYLAPAVDIPYCHHERWDGNGYPQGLAGEDIPLAARIFAAIDVFEALTSDRPYRKAWSRDEALEHIRNESGSQFDPRVVEVFLDLMR